MMLVSSGQVSSITNFITVLFIFLFVICITWFATRYMASLQKQRMDTTNIEIIETSRIGQNKYLQIVRVGDKYLVIAVSKDQVTMLTELSMDSIVRRDADQAPMPVDFSAVLQKMMKKTADKTGEEKQADKNE